MLSQSNINKTSSLQKQNVRYTQNIQYKQHSIFLNKLTMKILVITNILKKEEWITL